MDVSGIRGLERLPPEIWQEIICHACTDGGATGRALALSCKFFHDQSLNLRFYSLSFGQTSALIKFLVSLRMQPKECRPIIHHLFLTPTFYPGHVSQRLRHLIGQAHPNAPQCDPLTLTVTLTSALLSLAARTLRTLCLFPGAKDGGGAPLRPFAQAFPNLEELSVWNHPLFQSSAHAPAAAASAEAGLYSNPVQSDSDASPGCAHHYIFPSLRRMHVVLGDASMPASHLLRQFPTLVSARLTHLRLSGVTYADGELPEILAQLVGVPAPRPLRERLHTAANTSEVLQSVVPSEDAPFPHLRHLVIYAIQPRHDSPDPFAFSKWATLLGLLRELERTCRRVSGMKMVVLERSWMRKPRWESRLWNEWLQRMQGGRGCWVESEMEESRIEGPVDAPKDVEMSRDW